MYLFNRMDVLIFPTVSSILIVTCLCVFLRITLNSKKHLQILGNFARFGLLGFKIFIWYQDNNHFCSK